MNKKILIILLLALAVRMLYFFQINGHFLFKEPILDAKYYHEWALEISKGDWLGKNRGVFMMSPGYSYFLAVVYKVFGSGTGPVVFLQFLLGLLSGFFIYKLARKLFSETAALLGAVFYLFYSLGIFYESTLLKASVINFVNILSLYLLVEGGAAGLALSGALLGFSVHLRPNILLFVPVVLYFLFRNSSEKFKPIAVFLAGLLLVLMPVGLRNLKVGGEFVVSTAHGGMNFFTGNSRFCMGPYTPMPFARTDPEVEQSDFLKEAERLAGKPLTFGESSKFWYQKSFEYIRTNPGQWLKLAGRKALIFINSYEPAINLDYYFFRSQYKSVLSLPLFGFGIIFPLAVIGLFYARRNILLDGYMLVYAAAGIIFFVVSEYRFPIVPVLCVYAGFGAGKMYLLLKNRKYMVVLPFAAVLLLANYDIYAGVFGFNTYKKAGLANSYFGLGVTYEDKGMINEAVETYKSAISIMPQAAPMINLADIYEKKGKINEAEDIYRKALLTTPRSAEVWNNLGGILYRKKDYNGALECFSRAVYLKPGFIEAENNLRIVRQTLGHRP